MFVTGQDNWHQENTHRCSSISVAGAVSLVTWVVAPLMQGKEYFLNENMRFTAAISGFASIINAAVALRSSSWNGTTGLNDVPNTISVDDRIQVAIAVGVLLIWTPVNCLKIDQQGNAISILSCRGMHL